MIGTQSDIIISVRRFARNYAKSSHRQPYWNANGIQGLVTGLPENLRAAPLQNHARPYQRLPQIHLYENHRQHQVRLRQIRMKRKLIWNTYGM